MLKIKWDAVEIVCQSYISHSMKAGVMELIFKGGGRGKTVAGVVIGWREVVCCSYHTGLLRAAGIQPEEMGANHCPPHSP